MQWLDIHTHSDRPGTDTLGIRNIMQTEWDILDQIDSFISLGIHPWYLSEDKAEYHLQKLAELSEDNKLIAIGEIGLDWLKGPDKKLQEDVFIRQIQIHTDKPLIIHCVKAHADLLRILNDYGNDKTIIFHAFPGPINLFKQMDKSRHFFSFGEQIFRQGKARQCFAEIPLDKIFLETDNSDIIIEEIYREAAKIRNIETTDLQEVIWSNFNKAFGYDGRTLVG